MVERSGSPQTVMVVDDYKDIRVLVRLQLEMLGYRVVEASSGIEAVEVARKECPAMILMDINMPLLDGLSATRLIRGMAKMCDLVIVAFSAFSSDDNRAGTLAARCNEYLMKPIDFDRLSQVVERHLSTG